MKVCMVTTGHSAFDDRIFYKEAVSLRQSGCGVTILAPLNEEGSLFDMGGNSLGSTEVTAKGVLIKGFAGGWRQPSALRALARSTRLTEVGALSWLPEPFPDLIRLGTELAADVYHCHEIWSLQACIEVIRRLRREGKTAKLIYDVHEYTPAAYSTSKRLFGLWRRWLRWNVTHFEREALPYVDYVITANHITRGYLLTLDRFIQTEVIYNSPIISAYEAKRSKGSSANKITICHEGSLSFDRGLKIMLEVMRLLKNTCHDGVELLIVGRIPKEEGDYLRKKRDEYGLQSVVKCTGWLPYEELGHALSQADIGLILMDPTENNMLAGPPNKLFNYMGAGIPVVSVDLPETSRIIREAECGLIAPDRTATGLVDTLSLLIGDDRKRRELGENGRKSVEDHYSWSHMATRLLKVYEEVINRERNVCDRN